jgi:SAM-dependent methyltransferase
MPQHSISENVSSTFFHGYYKEIWRQIFPEKTSLAEVDFIIEEGKLTPGSSVLDLMCGYGRHSLELARRGMKVTAIDNLPDYTGEISSKAKTENLEVETICGDVLKASFTRQYDAAICMGNSLQFFNETDLLQLLNEINAHLKPGGLFLINTWSVAEIIIKHYRDKSWGRFGDLLFLTECKIHFRPTRMETTSIIITDSGEREEKKAVDFIYSLAEMESMLNKSGLRIRELYSIPGKKQFIIGDQRLYITAGKNLS